MERYTCEVNTLKPAENPQPNCTICSAANGVKKALAKLVSANENTLSDMLSRHGQVVQTSYTCTHGSQVCLSSILGVVCEN